MCRKTWRKVIVIAALTLAVGGGAVVVSPIMKQVQDGRLGGMIFLVMGMILAGVLLYFAPRPRETGQDEYKVEAPGPLDIRIRYLADDLPRLTKVRTGDWIDLRARERIELPRMGYREIPLGIAMHLPKGYEAHMKPRSGTFKHWGIVQTNSVATIDESYCGDNDEWKMPVVALRNTVIEKGDRICQFRIVEKMPAVSFVEVDSLGNPDRGGLGSTGKS